MPIFELLKVTKKGLKYRVVSEIGAEMTAVLDLGKEVPFGSSYRKVW